MTTSEHRAKIIAESFKETSIGGFLEKGSKANIGEIREWQGKKYQKGLNGWEKVPNVKKWKEKFVDEDTGEVVEVEREENLDKPEPAKKKSPSQERRERKADKISDNLRDNYTNLLSKRKEEESELNYLKSEKRQINSDMEVEAGEKGDSWSDSDGNKYGEMLNEIDSKIEKQKQVVNQAKKLEAEAARKYSSYDPEERYQPKDMKKGEDPCWDGYEQVGMKDKNGKKVPNCVPVEKSEDEEEIESGKLTKAQAMEILGLNK